MGVEFIVLENLWTLASGLRYKSLRFKVSRCSCFVWLYE